MEVLLKPFAFKVIVALGERAANVPEYFHFWKNTPIEDAWRNAKAAAGMTS